MPVLRSLIEQRSNPLENPTIPLSNAAVAELFGHTPVHSGVSVSPESALRVIAVYSAVSLIAGTIGSLPLRAYRLRGDGRRQEIQTDNNRVVWGRPNPTMTQQVFKETVAAHILLWGNSFSWKVRDNASRIAQLRPIPPDRVKVGLSPNGEKIFDVQGEAAKSDEILHIPGFTLDGLVGLSPIRLAREGIGLAMAAEESAARFYGQGSQLSGVLTTPNALTPQEAERLAKQWAQKHSGLKNSHLPAILDNGATWQTTGIPPDDAQFLETRQFEVREIARLYRVPPHLIGDVSGSTSWGTGIEQQNLGFHRYTLMPYLSRIEQAYSDEVTGPDNQYVKFSLDSFLRGDVKARYEAYAIGRNGGWLSVNDILNMEDRDPIADGDTYLQPMNMQTVGNSTGNQPGEGVNADG